MGQAKRRKEALGDAYGTPESSESNVQMPSFLLANDVLSALLSRDQLINLVEACQKSGPWERRYAPIEEQKHLCKEVVVTCYTSVDIMVALLPTKP